MTKAAVAALTRGMARDPRGITVNTVQPGPTETDGNPDENIRAMLRPMMALGRIGKDSLIAYLASPEASFVTGAALTVDGGYLSSMIAMRWKLGDFIRSRARTYSANPFRQCNTTVGRDCARVAATGCRDTPQMATAVTDREFKGL